MRFVLGLLIGIVLGVLVMWLEGERGETPPTDGGALASDPTADDAVGPRAPVLTSSAVPRHRAEGASDVEDVPEGALHIGDGLDLAAGVVRRRGEQPVDIVVHDITQTHVTLGASHGGTPLRVPLAALTVPPEPEALFKAAIDAPPAMSDEHVHLHFANDREHTGVAFASSAAGDAYAVVVLTHRWSVAALERHVRLAAREVPTRDGGGVAALVAGASPYATPITQRELAAIRARWRAIALTRIPFLANQGSVLTGAFTVTESPPEPLALDAQIRTVVPHAYEGTVSLAASSAAVIEGDANLGEKSVVGQGAALVVYGDLTGTLTVGAHGLLVVEGDLLGTVKLTAHSSLHVRGLHRGKVVLGHWGKVILDQRPVGTFEGSDHPTMVLDAAVARAEMPKLFGSAATGGRGKLVVRHSDLEDGKHVNIAGWQEVHVGGEAWDAYDEAR